MLQDIIKEGRRVELGSALLEEIVSAGGLNSQTFHVVGNIQDNISR